MLRISCIFLAFVCVAGLPIPHPHDDAGIPPAVTNFHVKAGQDQAHEVTLDGIRCQFTFRAANAAHGEEWNMALTRDNGVYKCVIKDVDREPPHATFYGFSAHMFGAKDDQLSAYDVWDHEGALLEGDDFISEGSTLRSDSHFKHTGGLSQVMLTCK